jgi:hypothetical protein
MGAREHTNSDTQPKTPTRPYTKSDRVLVAVLADRLSDALTRICAHATVLTSCRLNLVTHANQLRLEMEQECEEGRGAFAGPVGGSRG